MVNKKVLFFVIPMLLVLSFSLFAQDNQVRISNDRAPYVNPQSVQYPMNLLAYNSRAFGYNAYGGTIALGPFKMWLSTPFGMTSLFTDPSSANFVQAASFANGYWYGVRYGTAALVRIDTSTGAITTLGTVTGIGTGSITGLGWDATTNTMYALNYVASASKVGTLNLTTFAWTGLTGTQTTGLPIDMAVSNAGNIYVNVITAPTTPTQIYQVNKTTGVFTALPSNTGYNGNYGQGMSWDHAVDTGYLAAYNYTTSAGELRKINIATGATTLVGTLTSEVDGFIIPGGASGPSPMVNPTNMCAYTNPTLAGWWAAASDWYGDTLYITGGSNLTSFTGSTTVFRYNINSNTMGANGVPIPEIKAGHSFTRCGNALYLIGGGSTTAGSTTCYKYDPANGSWTSIAPLPVALAAHNAVNWGDSVIFVVAGGYSTYLTSVYAYRPASNTWITSTSLPAGTGRRSAACGLTNGKIFLSCGYSGTFRNDLQIGTIGANASTITWAAGPVVPFLGGKTGSSRPGGTAVNGKFYMITGEVTPAPVTHDTIYIFDATSNTWSNIKGGRGGQAASNYWSVISNKVFPNGNIKIFIPGGSVTGGVGQLCCLQVPACTITGITIDPVIPENYKLSQNYPNPFNPVTKINYALPKSGLVTLKIYDILGKEVMTLVNDVKSAGNYTVDFNGANLSSGVYFYSLKSGDFSAVKKMTLIK